MLIPIRNEHAELRRFMRAFADLMNQGDQPDRAVLLQMRFDFSRTFRKHLATIDALVGAWRAGAGNGSAIRIGQTCVATMRTLLCDYSAHLRRWTPRDILADMAGYRSDVAALQCRLLDLLAWEERELAPLLLRAAA